MATSTPDTIFPCVACEVQKEIGAANSPGFDLNAACSGFLLAYQTAQAYIQAGLYKTILVIGADSMSQVIDLHNTGNLYFVWRRGRSCGTESRSGRGFLPRSPFQCSRRKRAYRAEPTQERLGRAKAHGRTFLHMDGQQVFKFAVRSVPEIVEELLKQAQMKQEDIDYFFLH